MKNRKEGGEKLKIGKDQILIDRLRPQWGKMRQKDRQRTKERKKKGKRSLRKKDQKRRGKKKERNS